MSAVTKFDELYHEASRLIFSEQPYPKLHELGRMLADGIRAAEDDKQIAKIIQLIVGELTMPRGQALVLATANAIIVKEGVRQ